MSEFRHKVEDLVIKMTEVIVASWKNIVGNVGNKNEVHPEARENGHVSRSQMHKCVDKSKNSEPKKTDCCHSIGRLHSHHIESCDNDKWVNMLNIAQMRRSFCYLFEFGIIAYGLIILLFAIFFI